MKKTIISILMILGLVGCGGGGDSTKVGTFIDAPVQGLKFETASQSGFTDQEGHFKYQEGEEITFYLGSYSFGGAHAAKAMMTPYDITPEVGNDYQANFVAMMLQSLNEKPHDHGHIVISEKIADVIVEEHFSAREFLEKAEEITGKHYTLVDFEDAKIIMDAGIQDYINTNGGGTDPQEQAPDIDGNSFINIWNHIDPDSTTGKNLLAQFQNYPGWINVAVSGEVHCTQYQYSASDLSSSYAVNGVHVAYYVKGLDNCTEYTLEATHPHHGDKAIVQSFE